MVSSPTLHTDGLSLSEEEEWDILNERASQCSSLQDEDERGGLVAVGGAGAMAVRTGSISPALQGASMGAAVAAGSAVRGKGGAAVSTLLPPSPFSPFSPAQSGGGGEAAAAAAAAKTGAGTVVSGVGKRVGSQAELRRAGSPKKK